MTTTSVYGPRHAAEVRPATLDRWETAMASLLDPRVSK